MDTFFRLRPAHRRRSAPGTLRVLLLLLFGFGASPTFATAAGTVPLDFNRQVRPILSDRCFQCHGPDEGHRKGGFRLDQFDSACGKSESGARPIVPGKPDASEAMRRVAAEDPDERMPPADSSKPRLNAAEIAILRQWIQNGAKYDKHWAFVKPVRVADPEVKQKDWPVNSIDRFVLARLEQNGLKPNPPAALATLLRRVSLDLTGLPPMPEEITAFERDTSPDAYDKVVDRLLKSQHFGERMASIWLDAARYADTDGYLQNQYRVSWPWRDWVVRAWNENKPYDRFVTEQLAGDMVPGATEDTKLATCFLRMHMITCEGGSLNDEFRVEYAADRAETVSTVFMGLTLTCCRCHDHKFDPLPQKEYYQLFSMVADPKGEVPVVEHSHDPAFAPLIRLNKDRYKDESERLTDAIKTAQERGNGNSKERLTLEQRMLDQGLPVMVMEENPKPRQNFVLIRGAYSTPDKARPVERGAVDSVFPWKPAYPRNRLGLAQWLTDADNPLTARVEVNRIWTALFGQGLVETQENFGQQGGYPSHPELLDTLAVTFREGGWDRKALVRAIVKSATYRQSSTITAEHLKADPTNRLLARANRRRLWAEAIRDQALFVSGLLNPHLGGHPVLPYQPAGIWLEGANSPGYGKGSLIQTTDYEQSSGAELYRRSLYTFWNRNAPPPQYMLFDAPWRSQCVVSRSTTNTPLQSLVTMNDIQFVEAARALAERTLLDKTLADDAARLAMIYRRCTGRTLASQDQQVLLKGLTTWRTRYRAQPQAAKELLAHSGEKPSQPGLDSAEHAAWTMVATAMLNLDATLVID